MKRFDLINWFIKKYNYQSYLEIGIDAGKCFRKIECKKKISIDPHKGKTIKNRHYRMESDKFFEKNKAYFDIIFIDGLHEKKQVLKDIENSLWCLNYNGTIILHDCNPKSGKEASSFKIGGDWNGTVWEAYAHLRATREDLTMRVLNIDYGCGIIQRGSQKLYTGKYDNYQDLVDNRNNILQFITMEELEKWPICV